MNNTLKLLFGMPRSGTTWLGKIFDSHPDTLYRHEPDSVNPLIDIPLFPTVEEADKADPVLTRFVGNLSRNRSAKVSATVPVFQKNYYSKLEFKLHQLSVLVAKAGAGLFGEFPIIDFKKYEQLDRLSIVWKSIESLGRVDLFAKLLDDSQTIVLIRHPCGYVASVLRGESNRRFGNHPPTSEDFGFFKMLSETQQARRRGLTLDRFRIADPIERLAWRWVLINEKAMEGVEQLNNCMVLRYEDLCKDPIGVSKKLFKFTELQWQTQTEEFIKGSTRTEKAAYYSVFKDPRRSAIKWKDELPQDHINKILEVTAHSLPGKLYQ